MFVGITTIEHCQNLGLLLGYWCHAIVIVFTNVVQLGAKRAELAGRIAWPRRTWTSGSLPRLLDRGPLRRAVGASTPGVDIVTIISVAAILVTNAGAHTHTG